MIRFLLIFIFSISVSACSIFMLDAVWTEAMPDQQYFVEQYEVDVENRALQSQRQYLKWISSFYLGNEISDGWLSMTSRVLDRIPQSEETSVIAGRLGSLGQRISAEWAKDNTVRVINTRSVGVWGDALLAALDQDDLNNYLDVLEQDVDFLMKGELDNEEIYFERYYEDDWF